jgi:ribosomal protein S18 acetylase RimI-like enzyme
VLIRPIASADVPFLELMFVAAADWNPARVKGESHWRADPTMEKYVGDWRDSDFGFLAEGDDGPVGAVWMRYFTAANPGYGFVDEQTPELSIGVHEGVRGQGVGRALMRAAIEAAPDRLSLSVEDGNRAIHLYESFGFVPVGREGNSTTMLWARELPVPHS